MDPYNEFNRQLEYYKYYENQKNNYIDLTLDGNVCVQKIAQIIFSKKENKLKDDLTGLLFNESMEITDLFCFLVEIILYGYDHLTHENILDLKTCTDDIVYILKNYFESVGFDVDINEEFIEGGENDAELYKASDKYYCEILSMTSEMTYPNHWTVLNYYLINNKNFTYMQTTPLENYKALFISNMFSCVR